MALKSKKLEDESVVVEAELVSNDAPLKKTEETPTEITETALMDIGVNVDTAVEQWNAYQELCGKLLDESDYQVYQQGGTSKRFPKKSAFFKLGRAFNVDTEIIKKEEYRHPKNNRVIDVEFTVKATLPNGRSVVATGSCDKYEKGKSSASAHDLRATAETRATNRAISKLIGSGDVSYEELNR